MQKVKHWTSQLYKEQKWLAFWENSVLTITCNEIMSSIPNVKSSYTLHKKNKFQFFQRQHTCTFPILMTGFKMGFVSLISLKWSTLIHSQLGLVRVPKNYSYQPPPTPPPPLSFLVCKVTTRWGPGWLLISAISFSAIYSQQKKALHW